MAEPTLAVEGLRTHFFARHGVVRAVDGVSFDLAAGEILAIVGESGCGKSVTALTLMGLTRGQNTDITGEVRFGERELVGATDSELLGVRGAEMAMIFQNPMTSLDPVYRVGDQIAEQIRVHEDVTAAEARARSIELLDRVGIPHPESRVDAYPHEFSGGMRQRVMIAMALSCSPRVLIADEPTTALDVTVQAQILERVLDLRRDEDAGIILITHDLGVVAEVADRVAVMYAGRVVEQGSLDEIFYDPTHPYTWGLLGSVTRLDRDHAGRLPSIAGAPPSLISPPPGCHFRPRCPHAFGKCEQAPPLEQRDPDSPGHLDRCWLDLESKRSRRQVRGGIGLETTEEAPA